VAQNDTALYKRAKKTKNISFDRGKWRKPLNCKEIKKIPILLLEAKQGKLRQDKENSLVD